ncbi:MAG: selenide, water dikinase SelD, partial [Hydrogenovibrio sp.]|nr:selenide, water dikinase SelD [Hydrogenovibrio sp.]
GTQRNFDSFGHKASGLFGTELTADQRAILCDPQTSGGLLVAVKPEAVAAFHDIAKQHGLALHSFGKTVTADSQSHVVEVIV